jgi:deferrochelatase/peroxidase EfeB
MAPSQCPFHAYIRKANPRDSGDAQPDADERKHLMVRRGQTYGQRADVPFDTSVPSAQRPTAGESCTAPADTVQTSHEGVGRMHALLVHRYRGGRGVECW